MAYLSSARVSEIRKEIKVKFPKFKFSITRSHHSGVNIAIMQSNINLGGVEFTYSDVKYLNINTSWFTEHYKHMPRLVEFIQNFSFIIRIKSLKLLFDAIIYIQTDDFIN